MFFQSDIDEISRHPSIPQRPAPKPAVLPRQSTHPEVLPQIEVRADVHVISADAGADTIRQSFEPPPAMTHIISDSAGSQTIRDSFEPPHAPLTNAINDYEPPRYIDQQSSPRYTDVDSAAVSSRVMLRQPPAVPSRPRSVSNSYLITDICRFLRTCDK